MAGHLFPSQDISCGSVYNPVFPRSMTATRGATFGTDLSLGICRKLFDIIIKSMLRFSDKSQSAPCQ